MKIAINNPFLEAGFSTGCVAVADGFIIKLIIAPITAPAIPRKKIAIISFEIGCFPPLLTKLIIKKITPTMIPILPPKFALKTKTKILTIMARQPLTLSVLLFSFKNFSILPLDLEPLESSERYSFAFSFVPALLKILISSVLLKCNANPSGVKPLLSLAFTSAFPEEMRILANSIFCFIATECRGVEPSLSLALTFAFAPSLETRNSIISAL